MFSGITPRSWLSVASVSHWSSSVGDRPFISNQLKSSFFGWVEKENRLQRIGGKNTLKIKETFKSSKAESSKILRSTLATIGTRLK